MSEPYPPREWPDPKHELHGTHDYRPGNAADNMPDNLYDVTAIDKITDLVLDELPAEVAAYHGYPATQYDIARSQARILLGDLLYEDAQAVNNNHSKKQMKAIGEQSLRLVGTG